MATFSDAMDAMDTAWGAGGQCAIWRRRRRGEDMRKAAWGEEALERADGVSPSDLDAHRHVLEMARTIEVLRRDYELMQSELSAAYAQLRECSSGGSGRDTGASERERPVLGLRGDEADCCSRQREVDELRKVVPLTLESTRRVCNTNSCDVGSLCSSSWKSRTSR